MSDNREPTVTMDELAAVLGDESANDLWALILKNRQPKLSLTKAQAAGAIEVLDGRSKAKGDYEALGKAAAQWARSGDADAVGLLRFVRGEEPMPTPTMTEAQAAHPAVRYSRRQETVLRGAVEEAPAEETASKRSPRRGPRPV